MLSRSLSFDSKRVRVFTLNLCNLWRDESLLNISPGEVFKWVDRAARLMKAKWWMQRRLTSSFTGFRNYPVMVSRKIIARRIIIGPRKRRVGIEGIFPPPSLHEARILRENFARREEICILGSSSRFPYEFRINNSIRAKKSFLTTLPSDRFARKKFSLSFENKLLSPF